MLASLLSKPQPSLSVQAKRLVAMRFLIYTGFQTSYFIGVIGTLTYADDASVVATSLAVLFMNVFVILGSFAGGAALDAWGPRRHFLLSIVGTLATGTAIIAFGSATGVVLLSAVFLGFTMGFAQPIATSYPAYLTDDPVELKDINSAIAMFSNVSIIVGPTLGGFVAAAASSRAVFVLMMLFTVLAFVVGWGFRPQTAMSPGMRMPIRQRKGSVRDKAPTPARPPALPSQPVSRQSSPTASSRYFSASFFFRTLATEPSIRSSRFSIAMSYASALSGWAGSRRPAAWARCWVPCSRSACRRTWSTFKTLLVALMSVGLGSLLYVGTPYVGVALVGQIALGMAGVSSTRSTTPSCKRRLRSSSWPRQFGHGLWKHVRRRGSSGGCTVAGGKIWRTTDTRGGGHSRDGGSRCIAAVWT